MESLKQELTPLVKRDAQVQALSPVLEPAPEPRPKAEPLKEPLSVVKASTLFKLFTSGFKKYILVYTFYLRYKLRKVGLTQFIHETLPDCPDIMLETCSDPDILCVVMPDQEDGLVLIPNVIPSFSWSLAKRGLPIRKSG